MFSCEVDLENYDAGAAVAAVCIAWRIAKAAATTAA
jgi:hypothetical protein